MVQFIPAERLGAGAHNDSVLAPHLPTYPPSPDLWRGRVLLVHEGKLSKGPDFPGSLLLLGLGG